MSAVQNLIRTIVSGKHHRLVDEQLHVNLDLSYITPRILATSYPASGLETVYRNSAADVAKFLNARHTGRHLILNLSERPYSAETFGERASVLEQGFPDHHAPPLEVAWRSCAAMHAWLLADPENIVVVHCLAGKGRTGVIIACYLILSGYLFEAGEGKGEGEGGSASHPVHASPTFVLPPPLALANQALGVFAQARGEGPKYASQRRIVRYFADVLRTTLLAESTRLQGVPAAAEEGAAATAAATTTAAAESADPDQPMPCLWEAALAMHALPDLPLPPAPTLSLLSCAVGGLHGLDAAHPHPHHHHRHFALVINSAPYQGHDQFSFYDSAEGPEEAVTVVQGYELGGAAPAAGTAGTGAAAAAAPSAAATEPAAAAGATPAHASGASWLSSMVAALSSGVGGGSAAPAAAPTLHFSVEHTSLKGDLLLALQSVGPAGHEHPVQVFRAACHSEWQLGGQGAPCSPAHSTHTHTHTHTNTQAHTAATHAAPPPSQPPFSSRSASAMRTLVCTALSLPRQTLTRASTPGLPSTWTRASSASSSSAWRWMAAAAAARPLGKSPGPQNQPLSRRHGRMTKWLCPEANPILSQRITCLVTISTLFSRL